MVCTVHQRYLHAQQNISLPISPAAEAAICSSQKLAPPSLLMELQHLNGSLAIEKRMVCSIHLPDSAVSSFLVVLGGQPWAALVYVGVMVWTVILLVNAHIHLA